MSAPRNTNVDRVHLYRERQRRRLIESKCAYSRSTDDTRALPLQIRFQSLCVLVKPYVAMDGDHYMVYCTHTNTKQYQYVS